MLQVSAEEKGLLFAAPTYAGDGSSTHAGQEPQ